MVHMNEYKTVLLSHGIDGTIPHWGEDTGFALQDMLRYQDCHDGQSFCVQRVSMHAGIGTHIDVPGHCFPDMPRVQAIGLTLLYKKLHVVDVSERSYAGYQCCVDDITAYELQHGQIERGSVVCFYTGWSKKWHDADAYKNQYQFPTIEAAAAQLLVERSVVAVGIDTLGPDNPVNNAFAVHGCLLKQGIYIVENVAFLDRMPLSGGYVSIVPLLLNNATETPVTIIGYIK